MAVNQIDIEVGKRINEIVERQQNLSSRQFALSIGMDPSHFAKILKGSAAISIEKLVEISSKYHVGIDWLITGHLPSEWNEDVTGYKKPAPGKMPEEAVTMITQELGTIRASLGRIETIVSGQPGLEIPGDPRVIQDLGLDKKVRTVKGSNQKKT